MSISDVASAESAERRACSDSVNPQWARLLNLLDMDARYVECRGDKPHPAAGRTIPGFPSGICVNKLHSTQSRRTDASSGR